MALTESVMFPLGKVAPSFALPDVISNKVVTVEDVRSEIATVVMFICNHCPYVVHVQEELIRVAEEYMKKAVTFVAINSNDVEKYPEDGPKRMKEVAKENNYPFPYLFDETQDVAKAFDAACTPDFYVFDKDLRCVYRGQLDGSRPGNEIPVTGKSLRDALDALFSGGEVSKNQRPSSGCNIKWK